MSLYLHCFHPGPSHLVPLSSEILQLPLNLPSLFCSLQSILSTSLGEIPVKSQIVRLLHSKPSNRLSLHSDSISSPHHELHGQQNPSPRSPITVSSLTLPQTQSPCFIKHAKHIPAPGPLHGCLFCRHPDGHVFSYSCVQLQSHPIGEVSCFSESPCDPKTVSKDLTSTLSQSEIHAACWCSASYWES